MQHPHPTFIRNRVLVKVVPYMNYIATELAFVTTWLIQYYILLV